MSDTRVSSSIGPDGQSGWRTFAFEWHTDNPSVQYYMDGVLYHNSSTLPGYTGPLGSGTADNFYVPFLASRFNLAAWCPYAVTSSYPYSS